MDEANTITVEGSEKTGVEFPKELLKLVRKKVIDRDIRMKDAVREAFNLWLEALASKSPKLGVTYVDPVVELTAQVAQLVAANERLHRIIEARVVEVANAQEKEMVEGVVGLLHWREFVTELKKFTSTWKAKDEKRRALGQPARKTG